MLKKLNKTSFLNSLVVFILGITAFLRLFRINELLGFWYDQGRDALVIWDLIYSHKFFLIGPTTGLEGVFRGPWYYWLITPFYLLGKGNPVWPSVFLILTTVIAIYIFYKVTQKWFGNLTAIIFVLISSFSYYLFSSSRWLSNPTPMFLISALYLLGFSYVMDGKKWGLYLVAGMSGMAMQFGSAAEIFYIPAAIIILILYGKKLLSIKTVLLSLLFISISFLPQFLFDARHGWVISKALYANLFGTKAAGDLTGINYLTSRMSFYYDVISSKLFSAQTILAAPFWILGLIFLFIKPRIIFDKVEAITVFIITTLPFVGLLFFKGNYGNLYDYYFTGYYLFIILIFSILLTNIKPVIFRNIALFIFIPLFAYFNIQPLIKSLSVNIYQGDVITLGAQEHAIDYIYKNAGSGNFNVDIYVPPVIPYAYQYLFEWLGTTKYQKLPDENKLPLLYTLEEADPSHPERIAAWYARQAGIGTVQVVAKFGMITVERRERINEK